LFRFANTIISPRKKAAAKMAAPMFTPNIMAPNEENNSVRMKIAPLAQAGGVHFFS
jgi:hypothetical protein